MRDFKNIKAWKHADDLAVAVYSKTKIFPKEEMYGLTSQLRRAAVSVPANIAEGAGRGTLKEYLHFLYIARGSLSETGYLIHLSCKLGYFAKKDYEELTSLVTEVSKTLYGLISAVKKEA